jgi:hypothetical protein
MSLHLASAVSWALLVPFVAIVATPSFGAEFRADAKVVVKSDEVIEDDLYACGEVVVIEGTVKGDVIAAGRSIEVKGTVEGDLIAVGQGVLIDGRVTDDVRIAGQVLKVSKSGYIGGDLLAAGYSLESESGSSISADTLYAGYQALLAGKVGRNLRGSMANCQLDGEVVGNVWAEVEGDEPIPPQAFGQPPPIPIPDVRRGFKIGQEAKIGGKLTYRSIGQADIANPQAIVGGVEHLAVAPKQQGPAPQKPGPEQLALERLRGFAPAALVGLLTVLLVPIWTTEMAANLRFRPGLCLVGSIVGFFGFFVLLAAIVGITIAAMVVFGGMGLNDLTFTSLGLGVFGSISVTGLFWFALSFLAPTLVAVFVGRLVGRSPSFPTIAAYLIGLVLVALLWSIPHAGFWIATVLVALGFGSFCVWLVAGPPEKLEMARAATTTTPALKPVKR